MPRGTNDETKAKPSAPRPHRAIRASNGRFLPGSHGPGRRPGVLHPGVVWRNAMFRAWLEGGFSAPEVQLAWLKGEVMMLADGSRVDFADPELSTAERWLHLQKLFAQLAPKEVQVSGEADPEARAAALARDRGIAVVMETLFEELDARAARRRA